MELVPGLGMPRWGRLVAVVTVGVAVLLGALGVGAVATDGDFPTSAIADYAEAHYPDGSGGGQCILFVERVVDATFAANGLSHSFPEGTGAAGYYGVFQVAGAQLVAEAGPGGYATALAGTQRGEIVQLSPLSPASSASPWFDNGTGHQHTAILLGGYAASTQVIDSNWDLNLRVLIHPLSQVVAQASRWGLELAVWSFGLPDG